MRADLDTYREIADSLLRNRGRSLLTGFGVFWGLFMLLFMVGGGNGLKQMLMQNFNGFATNTMVIYSEKTSIPSHGFRKGRSWDLELKDIDRLRSMVPELDVVTCVCSDWGQNATHGIHSYSSNIKGLYPEYTGIEQPLLKYGRYLSEADCSAMRKVCILGKRVYNSLFPEGGDPCGQRISVGGIYYTVIGVDFNTGNLSINGSADETIVVPFPVLQQLLQRGEKADLLAMTGRSGVKMSELEPRIRQVIARSHSFSPDDRQALGVVNTEQIFALMDNLFRGVNFLIWLVGLGTILAGAIGVSNIMMVTVKERTTEIGIRRAIGATPGQILSQIIMESMTLTLAAGMAGIVFSVLLLGLLETVINGQPDATPATFQIGFWTAVAAAALLSVLGAAAGMAPALRAMKIKPVDAMREE